MRRSHPAVLFLGLFLLSLSLTGDGFAAPVVTETDMEDLGDGIVVTWDAGFEDLDYTLGEEVTIEVGIAVDGASASVAGVMLRGKEFTPRSKRSPAAGELLRFSANEDGSVSITLVFSELHTGRRSAEAAIGNAHLSVILSLDTNGDGLGDSRVKLGVNLHVEDPAEAE